MALKTSLRPFARRIGRAVAAYAASQGLLPGDYAFAGTWNKRTDYVGLVLGTDRPIDERQWYADILRAIREAFPEDPGITFHIGLVVENVRSLDEVYLRFSRIDDEDEIDLTDLLERA